MKLTLVVIFLLLNVMFGLAQLWIGALYWLVHKHELMGLETLLRDGALLFFGTGLVASATYAVIPKPSVLSRHSSAFALVIILLTVGVIASGVMYGMELAAAKDAGTEPSAPGWFLWVQLGWASAAVAYAFWIAYITDSLREGRSNVFS